ncbi:MAG: acetyl-CoA carboxylase biotin carboxylase subunit [Aquabacterium sp.]|nr:acetyl-CoA carboxylase biotin carboxylase subunit [Aquabacterium sp.]
MSTATPLTTPFSKILIANRGEIALRVMRSALSLGYRTVAVYSSADALARHVLEADQAVCIGEPLPRQSYLNIPAIIDAARRSGADAVHPGYGFLAENAAFAAACAEAGLVFIGPPAAAITAMGDKAGAKALMAAAGVPVIPGYQGEDQSAERLAKEAAAIGWPVMIKATAGGGGRGMRRVDRAVDFAASLQSAQSEALGAFGDATVILERALIAPRHIEIQVFADRHGHAIHLGERDCSVQRRHQKVIEEAPSPAVNADLRARMGAVAVKAVLAIGYVGAGTLEFLLDAQGEFFFMEMNTRLQVEHPVTEAITGLDLVDWQLRVAAGEPLPLTQEQVRFSGHAIEVRLCAEDALQNFMPQSGQMREWSMPEQGPGALRVEHALRPGDQIPPYYDSMIAKLVAHGSNRAEALRRLQRGLQDAVALGVATNQAFLSQCLAHPVFAEGGATTAFIGDHQATLLAGLSRDGDATNHRRAAALAALLLHLSDHDAGPARELAHRMPTLQRFALNGTLVQGTLTQPGPDQFNTHLDGDDARLQLVAASAGQARVLIDGLAESARWHRDGHQLLLHFAGRAWQVDDLSRAPATRGGEGASDGKLRASMNGRVVAVQVAVGDVVTAGQPLLTLEAMKMEHVHAAPCAGSVVALHVSLGEQVAAHRVVAEIA